MCIRDSFNNIREVFEDLALKYGEPAADSIVINRGTSGDTPTDDLLGRSRDNDPDMGAVEVQSVPANPTTPTDTSQSFISALLLLLFDEAQKEVLSN